MQCRFVKPLIYLNREEILPQRELPRKLRRGFINFSLCNSLGIRLYIFLCGKMLPN